MDQNYVEGTLRKGVGRIEDAAGALTGDAKSQTEGKTQQLIGGLQQSYGSAVETVQTFAKEQPLMALGIVGGIAFLIGLMSARR